MAKDDRKRIWTVDVEYDWGGRTNGTQGIDQGLTGITEAFKDYSVKGIFFISGELSTSYPELAKKLRLLGHKVGSHGYFHTKFKEGFRRQEDKNLSQVLFKTRLYRAPKFYWDREDSIYSSPRNHTGLLKRMWLSEPIREIIYLHPFDIVETKESAPNLFCKLWYSQPKRAYKTFLNLLERYH
jgi:Polysaccharide deacetylase